MQSIQSRVHSRCARSTSGALQVASACSAGALIAAGFLLSGNVAHAAGNTFIVDTNGDPGPPGTQSLRQAIGAANASAGNTIQFSNALVGSTITLANGEIAISQAMNIVGPGAGRLTISGNDATRLFLITAPGTVAFSGITLTRGHAAPPLAGGAIGAFYTSVALQDSVISDSAAKAGGGMFAMNSNVTIVNSHIAGNTATYSGAGVLARCAASCGAAISVSQSTITGNVAGQSGAGLYAYHMHDVTISQSLFNANRCNPPTGQRGGAIFLYAVQNPKIVNSTITGNYAASEGGAIYADFAYIAFSTITQNATQSDSSNGLFAASGGEVQLQDSIVANNTNATSTSDLSGTITANFSLIKSPGSASLSGTNSIIGVDPQLGALANHGGATATMLPASSGPAVNAGEVTPAFAVDQRGLPRPVATHADIGAVELQTTEDVIFRDRFEGY